MNSAQRDMLDRLEAMPISQARLEIAIGTFGEVDSPNYIFCSSWLAAKEADLREAKDSAAARWARHAAYAAYAAAIMAAASIIKDMIR